MSGFAPGDWVLVTKRDGDSAWVQNMDIYDGGMFQIKERKLPDVYTLVSDDKYEWWFNAIHLSPAVTRSDLLALLEVSE